MYRKILFVGLTKKEIENINKCLDEPCEILPYRVGTKEHKQKIKNKLIKLIEENNTIEANKNVCKYLEIQTRTLSRYIRELKEENKIIATKTNFKSGGRGYKLESIVPKKRQRKKKI